MRWVVVCNSMFDWHDAQLHDIMEADTAQEAVEKYIEQVSYNRDSWKKDLGGADWSVYCCEDKAKNCHGKLSTFPDSNRERLINEVITYVEYKVDCSMYNPYNCENCGCPGCDVSKWQKEVIKVLEELKQGKAKTV